MTRTMDAPGQADVSAAGSSFYAAMNILPRQQRRPMFAVYAFCRAVDDIADGTGDRAERLGELDRWRRAIGEVFAGHPPPHLADLSDAIVRFDLRRADFEAVIDGVTMDAAADLHAPDWSTLDLYCDRVASAVGRLSVRIFGVPDDEGEILSRHLGRALQFTNILRDIDEDAAMGRLYLPRESFVAAGMSDLGIDAVLADPRLDKACRWLATRAHTHYAEADRCISRCRRDTVRAPRLMAIVYRDLLDQLTERGWQPPRCRVAVGKLRMAGAALRYGIL